jgi:hypothetical protein
MSETLSTYQVPEHHVMQFTGNVQHALQKMPGLLMQHVTRGAYVGEKAQVVNFIGPVFFQKRTTKYSDTEVTEPEHTQRWIYGDEFDTAMLVDRLDTLKMIYEPTNMYVEAFRVGAARKQDDIIMEAFFAVAKAGKHGNTNVSFPAADTIANGGTRMSVAKLRAARKRLKLNHVDLRMTRPLIAVTAHQIDDLLGEVAVGSSDYNAVKPLVDGEVNAFMGFTFVPYEDQDAVTKGIPTNVGGTVRYCPVWVPEGMHYGSWQELVITINNRADKNNIKQIHGTFTAGATRREEGRVLMLECVE